MRSEGSDPVVLATGCWVDGGYLGEGEGNGDGAEEGEDAGGGSRSVSPVMKRGFWEAY